MRTDSKKKKNTIVLNKLGIICISIIILMNIIGVGYGSWNSGMEFQSVISTGSIDPVFIECEIKEEKEKKERNKDESEVSDTRLSDEAIESSEIEEPEEEEEEEEASYVEISNDRKRMDVFIKNAYPGYKAKIEYRIENNGTIPILCEVTCESIEYIDVQIEEPEGIIYGFGDGKEGVIEIELDKKLEKEPDKDKAEDSDKHKRRGRGERDEDEEENADPEDLEDTVDYEFTIDLTFRQYNVAD